MRMIHTEIGGTPVTGLAMIGTATRPIDQSHTVEFSILQEGR
jgi:hypothetical protein